MFGLNMLRPLGARGFSSSAVVEKLKTHKGTAKRFSVTGSGIVSACCFSYYASQLSANRQFRHVRILSLHVAIAFINKCS